MSPSNPSDFSLVDAESDATYSVDILARLSGVSSETILRYHERGLLRSIARTDEAPSFDLDAMRRLRQLESLREAGDMSFAGLCLVSRLLDEIDRLRDELRGRSQ
ncbi:MAG: MerR family transcriptional regulator [Verrucomicrobiales bacterium]